MHNKKNSQKKTTQNKTQLKATKINSQGPLHICSKWQQKIIEYIRTFKGNGQG